jgi:hypothetical protein
MTGTKKTLVTWLDSSPLESINQTPILLFHGGSEYPLLFFTVLSRALQTKNVGLQNINADQVDVSALENTLATTFLGQSLLYHVRDMHVLDAKKYKKIISIFSSYQGPHCVLMWLPTEADSSGYKGSTITLPNTVDKNLMISIARAFGFARIAQNPKFLAAFFAKSKSISLEFALLLCSYGTVLGVDSQIFIDQWLDRLVESSPSLFTLAQHFFARDEKKFGELWHTIKLRYAGPFWISFWGEQLFRAACVIHYHKIGNDVAKKKISFRLPFSFLSTGIK